jgi:hypothetical protein
MNKKYLITIGIFLIYLSIFTSQILAQIAKTKQVESISNIINFKQPEPPPDSPKTGRAKGGASRGQCFLANSKSAVKITPLLPLNGWGLTVSESPTLWLDISYSSAQTEVEKPFKAELSVEERAINIKLEPKNYSFELPKRSGIFSISIPHLLESNKWYRWYLVINCQPQSSAPNDILELGGFIYRKELNNFKNFSDSLSLPELMQFYIKNNTWYDAFHEAALLHCKNWPDNELKNYWQTLLKSEDVKLDEVSNQSLMCSH